MNWIDGILVVLLVASVIVGSKKGLIRELMAFVVFFVAIIFSVNYIDDFSIWVYNQLGGSPLTSAFLSFVVLLTLSYAAFKILGLLFYKIANIKQIGRKDQMGGALVGFLRGWVAIGFLTFLVFLLPLPESFYTSFESSFFGEAVAKTVPLIYEGTTRIHPNNPDFMEKIEKALRISPAWTNPDDRLLEEDRIRVNIALRRIEKFFSTSFNQS